MSASNFLVNSYMLLVNTCIPIVIAAQHECTCPCIIRHTWQTCSLPQWCRMCADGTDTSLLKLWQHVLPAVYLPTLAAVYLCPATSLARPAASLTCYLTICSSWSIKRIPVWELICPLWMVTRSLSVWSVNIALCLNMILHSCTNKKNWQNCIKLILTLTCYINCL